MCSVCNQFICPVDCPEFALPRLYTCAVCQDGICDGERYYKIGSSYFHRKCLLDSYDNEELLRLLVGPAKMATKWSLVFRGEINEE